MDCTSRSVSYLVGVTLMPIKRRSKKPFLYVDRREAQWENQGRDRRVNFHSSNMKNGSPLDGVYLKPKPISIFKDIWFCRTADEARLLVCELANYIDVIFIEFKGKWVYVDFKQIEMDRNTLLPGQPVDDRSKVRGR